MNNHFSQYLVQAAKASLVSISRSLLTMVMVCVASYGYAQSTLEQPKVSTQNDMRVYMIKSVQAYRENGQNKYERRYLRANRFDNSQGSMTAEEESVFLAKKDNLSNDDVNCYYWILRQNSNGYYFTNYGGVGFVGTAKGVTHNLDGSIAGSSDNFMGTTSDQTKIIYFKSFPAIQTMMYSQTAGNRTLGSSLAGCYGMTYKYDSDVDRYVAFNQVGDADVWRTNDGAPTHYTGVYGGGKYWSVAFEFEKVDNPSIEVRFTRSDDDCNVFDDEPYNYYTSFCYSLPLIIPEGVKVWKLNSVSSVKTGEAVSIVAYEPTVQNEGGISRKILPAMEKVILSVDKDNATTEEQAQTSIVRQFTPYLLSVDPQGGTGLEGNVTPVELTGYDWQTAETPYYALGKKYGRVAFYKYADTVVPANRCYFSASDASEAKAITFDFSTDIKSVSSEAKANGDIYDLQGRKVVNPVRGLYIQNGKKIFVK